MGWANCGEDKNGRPIGYAHSSVCDHDGCNKEIDRGLSYACGGMHGDDEYSCEKYFCYEHMSNWVEDDQGGTVRVCNSCANELLESGDYKMDEDEGVIKRVLDHKVGE
jgi:hypothetical protein